MAEMEDFPSNHQHVCPVLVSGLNCILLSAPARIKLSLNHFFFSADFSFLHSCQAPGARISVYSLFIGWGFSTKSDFHTFCNTPGKLN